MHGVVPRPFVAVNVPVEFADLDGATSGWEIHGNVVSQYRIAHVWGVSGKNIISERAQHEAIHMYN